jgi:hypothetical protein
MLPTAPLPALITAATPVETALPNGPQPLENGEFEAILANSAAAATTPAASLLELSLDPEAAMAADTELPEGGKELPVAAEPLSEAVPAVTILALLPLPIVAEGGAAPLQPTLDRSQPPAMPPVSPVPGQPLPRLAPGKAAEAPAQPVPLPLPQIPSIAATALPPVTLQRDGPRQAPPPRVAATLRLLAEAAPDKAAAMASDLALAASPAAQGQLLPFVSVPVAASTNTPVTAPAALPAGHDFAQLIDRLVAARESTQPQAATLALAHAEFGKVELRFASDSTGLSVALASADPDFARAVQAAVPPVTASADSSAAQGRQQSQSGAHAESFAGQQHGQQTARREPQDRFVAANPAQRSADSRGNEAGIFA